MSCYAPTYTVPGCSPTYASSSSSPVCYPVGGVGSLSSGGGAVSYGGGGATTAASLGLAPGASISCVNQIPSSAVMIQPSPIQVVIPGAILTASNEPVRVGGYTACASGSSGSSSRTSRSMMHSSCRPYVCRS